MIRKLIFGSLILASFAGCKKENFCDDYNYCENSAPATEVQAVENYLSQNSIVATKHCSGVYFILQQPGSGQSPDICSDIAFKYTGTLTDGTVFDDGGNGQTVAYSLGSLIAGWQNTLPMLKPGGKIRLFIPPALGYGNQDQRDQNGNVVVPANSILIFDIELVDVSG